MNIYVLCLKVVEVRSFRGAESWWGGPLAYTGRSFIIYVTAFTYNAHYLDLYLDLITYNYSLCNSY
jgi:hypothetical protein